MSQPYAPDRTTLAAAARGIALLSVMAVATAALNRKRQKADRVAQAKSIVGRGVGVLLAIDIGSSSVRCSAYTVGASPVLVPGCAVQIKHAVVKDDGVADAREVIDLVDTAVDRCLGELRARQVAHAVAAVGFACFGMNLVGVDADGEPCTPVFTYAANSSRSTPSPSPSSSQAPPPPGGSGISSSQCPASDRSVKDDVMERLRESLERTGSGGGGGLEEARRRTGAPTHMSYAPAQLLRWLRATQTPASTVTTSATMEQRGGEEERPQDSGRQRQLQRRVKVWQTLPSLVAARWCRLASAPVSYSEASWMGLLDLRKLEWDAPTLSVLSDAGFDCSALPRLADVGDLRAGVSGPALKRWPELDGASVRLGLGDGAAACLGSGCDERSGLIAITIGTSAAARIVLRVEAQGPTKPAATAMEGEADAAATDDAMFRVPKGLWCYRVDRHRALLGGALTDGGSVFEWLRGTLALVPGEDQDTVLREAERMPPASHGLVVLPFFSGERSPGYNDDATASILGLRRSTTRPQLVRAGLESVCLRLAAIVDLMTGGSGSSGSNDSSQGSNDGEGVDAEGRTPAAAATAAAPLRRRKDAGVVTSGNALAASPFWRKLLADSLGRTVRASGVSEETSLGVAVLLSSLEGAGPRQRAAVAVAGAEAGRGPGSTGEASAEVGAAATAEASPVQVHTPDGAACRVYREAGLAQKRAYDAIFGTISGGPNDASTPGGV